MESPLSSLSSSNPMNNPLNEKGMDAPDLESLAAESQDHRHPDVLSPGANPRQGTPPNVPPIFSKVQSDRSPYALHYQYDAPIWARYLKETQSEDEELVKQWQTGVDSLMVFTGLFAGIQTAFLVESQNGLQEDPQEALLRQILQTLQNNPDIISTSTSPSAKLLTSSLAINYLWFVSLTLTLVSALALVLAKGCFTKYAPAFRGESSNDACDRHLRAMRFPQWRFGAFISGISLLIQISLFMFFGGLVVFVLDRNTGIGYAILGLVATTAMLYLLMTILPLLFPACPFQTTLSDFIMGATSNSRYRKNHAALSTMDPNFPGSGVSKPGSFVYKATISCSSVIASVFDAIPHLWEKARQFLHEVSSKLSHEELEGKVLTWIIVNSIQEETIDAAVKVIAGLPLSNLDKLKKAMHESEAVSIIGKKFQQSFKIPMDVHQIEVYLYALLQTVTMDSKSSARLFSLLELGQPLDQWDNLDVCLQALAFCVRTEIWLALEQDDHRRQWMQTKNSLMALPWIEVNPYLQKRIIGAMIRSLEGNAVVLQEIAAIVLALLLKTVDIAVLQLWPKDIEQTHIMRHVVVLMANPDSTVRDSANEIFAKLSWNSAQSLVVNGIVNTMEGIQHKSTTAATAQLNRKLDIHTAFYDTVKGTIVEVAPLLRDSDLDTQCAAVDMLGEMTSHIMLHGSLENITREVISLLEGDVLYTLSAAMNGLGILANQSELKDMISIAFPHAFVPVENPQWYTYWTALNMCVKLGKDIEHIYDVIHMYAPEVILLLKDKKWHTWWFGIIVIEKLTNQPSSHMIDNIIEQILNSLKNNNPDFWSAALNVLKKLVQHVAFHNAIKITVQTPVQMLNEPLWYIRLDGVNALSMLTVHAAFHSSILETLLLAKDDDPNVQLAAVDVLKKLATVDSALQDKIKEAVQDTLQLVNDINSYWPAQSAAAIVALGEWADIAEYHSMVTDAVPQVMKLVNSSSMYGVAAVTALGMLTQNSKFHHLIRDAVPSAMKLLNSNDWHARRAAVVVLGRLADHDEFQSVVLQAIPQAIDLLMDIKPQVQQVALETLEKLGQKGFLSKRHGKKPQV